MKSCHIQNSKFKYHFVFTLIRRNVDRNGLLEPRAYGVKNTHLNQSIR